MNKASVKSHGSTNTNTDKLALDRSDSSVTKLCDLHVYKVPSELWRDNLNNVLNNAVTDTVSVGIIRVPEELRLAEIRDVVTQQLAIHGVDLVPRDYVFLRSVGRSLTTLRGQQEHQLKAKHFLPPVACAPELYILEVTPEVRDALAISDASSSPLSQRASPSHRAFPPYHHTGYRGQPDSQDGDQPQPSLHSSRNGFKPVPRFVDTSARDFSRHSLFQSLPNNHNFSRSSHLHINPHSTHNNPHSTHNNPHSTHNNPHSTHNNPHSSHDINNRHNENNPQSTVYDKDNPHNNPHNNNSHNNNPHNNNPHNNNPHNNNPHNNNPHNNNPHNNNPHNNNMMWYSRNQSQQWHETSNHTPESRWGGQATHRQTTHTSHRQPPHTPATHSQLADTRGPDVSSDNQHQHWSAEHDGDHSPDGSRTGGWSLDDPHGRRHRGQDGGTSRHARGNHSDRLDSENDHEDQPEGHRGHGGARKIHKPHHGYSDEDERDLSSDDQPGTRDRRQKLGHEKNHLLKSLEETRMSRQDQENERTDLMRKAKQIRHKTTQYRNEARDLWKKKYFEEKKRTAPLEDSSTMLHSELEAWHRKQISMLEAPRDKGLRLVDGGPSDKSNHVIQCAKLRHEIEGLTRRVDLASMKLTSEMKLRVQAQAEMKAVRSEAMHNRLASRMPKASHHNTTVMTAAK